MWAVGTNKGRFKAGLGTGLVGQGTVVGTGRDAYVTVFEGSGAAQ